jgi:hypothetical protein
VYGRCPACPQFSKEPLWHPVEGRSTHCKCISVKPGEECPYYKEAESESKVKMTEERREALKKIRDALDFQISVCAATHTTSCAVPLTYVLYLLSMIDMLIDD